MRTGVQVDTIYLLKTKLNIVKSARLEHIPVEDTQYFLALNVPSEIIVQRGHFMTDRNVHLGISVQIQKHSMRVQEGISVQLVLLHQFHVTLKIQKMEHLCQFL